MDDRSGIEREFRYCLQALSLEPVEQARVMAPGCVLCELSEGFANWIQPFLSTFGDELTEEQAGAVRSVDESIGALPASDLECFNASLLTRPGWQAVRGKAHVALSFLAWPAEAPPEFAEVEPGVWRRPTA